MLEQSWDIVQWALTQEAAPASCQDAWRRAQTLNQALLGINDGVFKQHLDRYKYPERFAGSGEVTASADVRAHHRNKACMCCCTFGGRLARRPFSGGERRRAPPIGAFSLLCASGQRWMRRGGNQPICPTCVHGWLTGWRLRCLRPAWQLPSQQRVPSATVGRRPHQCGLAVHRAVVAFMAAYGPLPR